MLNLERRACPSCSADCLGAEQTCWQCGGRLDGPDKPELQPNADAPNQFDELINFSDLAPAPPAPVVESRTKRLMRTLTGETIEIEAPEEQGQIIAAEIGKSTLSTTLTGPVMRLTFCKSCGQQNDENAVDCRKCKTTLEVVEADSVPEIQKLPRYWPFDLLGSVWILLGFAAIYCGRFLVKATDEADTTLSDYFWTGVVACAPGIFIVLRHYFCKPLFWTMTLGSALVWSVIIFIWAIGHLHVSDNGQVGLMWLASLSVLSLVSYFTVRQNDAFDAGH